MAEDKRGKGPIVLDTPYRNIKGVPTARLELDKKLFEGNTNERLDYSIAIAKIKEELEDRGNHAERNA